MKWSNHLFTEKPRLTREKKPKIIFFDLETTGVNHPARHDGVQICSIAAATSTANGKWRKFTKFLIPTCNFMFKATEINGMTVVQKKLYKHGKEVKEAVPIATGLQQFIDWLSDFLETHKIIMVRKDLKQRSLVNLFDF